MPVPYELKKGPCSKGGGLAGVLALLVDQVPDRGRADKKAAARAGNADARIVIDIALALDGIKKTVALGAFHRLGRVAAWRAGERGPVHLPKTERGAIAVIQNRIRFGAGRAQNKRCRKNFAGQHFAALARIGPKRFASPMLVTGKHQPGLPHQKLQIAIRECWGHG